MITVNKYRLPNGLRLIHHADYQTQMVALNLLYDVGGRDESPEGTGFAHLFEHLMFGGSVHIADFDAELQHAGGKTMHGQVMILQITIPLFPGKT